LIYEAREQAAEYAVKEGYDYLFFLDSDMEPEPDTIVRLLAHNKDIVSAMAFKRVPPYSPCFYPKIEYDGKEAKMLEAQDWTRGIAEVDGVGMACCLIKCKVLEQIPKPLFFPLPVLAEDLGFCLRAKQAGFSIYVDTTLCCGHVGTMTVGEGHWRKAGDSL
jgi:GT2 family glycosyltransferase